jgi:hypothetical protein
MIKRVILGLMICFSFGFGSQITLEYPKKGFMNNTDYTLPAIPSTNKYEYKQELLNWINKYHKNLSMEDIEKYIEYSFLETSILKDLSINIVNENNKEESFDFIHKEYTIIEQMRDLVFLESFKSSIEKWEKDYILAIGTDQVKYEFADIVKKAKEIFNEYKNFSGKNGFFERSNNPLTGIFFGTGKNSYGNFIIADGIIEGTTEGLALDFTKNILSENINEGFKQTKVTLANPTTWKNIGIEVAKNIGLNKLEKNKIITPTSKVLIENLFTATQGVIAGGTGLIFAPAQIYYKTFSSFMEGYEDSSMGAYFTFYYYFRSTYPDKKKYLKSDGSINKWKAMSLESGYKTVCTSMYGLQNIGNNDKVAEKLCKVNLYKGFGNFFWLEATTKDKQYAMTMANLFMIIKSLDIESLKLKIVEQIEAKKYFDENKDKLKQEAITKATQGNSPSTLSIKTPQSITINDKSITASNGDEITLSFDDNFYFKDGIDGAKDLDNPYKIIYKSGYDYKTLSATYDDELNGLKFVVDTDQAFEIVKVEYLSSDGEHISIGLPSTWENVVLENSTQTSVKLDDGLVAHYEFEDNANDSSGNGNNGVEYGGVSYTDGVIGKAGSFDGIDDYIFISESDSLNVKKITMSYYIQTKDIDIKNFDEEWQVVNKERMYESAIKQYGEVSYAFDTENDTKYPYWIWYGTDYIMENDNFHHIAITYDGNYVKSYINGHIISTKSIQGNGNIEYHKSNVSIGVRNIDGYYSDGIPFNWFKGQIDDLRIYNRALNESEIQALYELGTTDNTQEEESTDNESNTEEPTQTVEEITNYTITPPTIDNIAQYYTDLPNGIKYQSDIYFATLKGIVHGYPSTTDNTKREFRPADNISLAETLKMILLSANDIGLIQLPKEDYFYKSYPIWAMPYYTFARNSGAIDTNKNDLSVIYPTREQIARLLVMALDLENRLQDFVDIDTIDVFDDEDAFGDEINLRYAKIAKAYGLFMTDTQARPTDTATRGEVASIISRLYMIPTANIDISKTTIEFGEEFDINFINKKAQKISNDTLTDSSDEVTSRFAINQREQNSTTIDSSNLNIGTNHITAIVSNNGVNNFLSKPITIDYSDKDSDGVQDHLDIWSDDSRYALDTNDNSIPDILDYIYGLENKSSTDTIIIDGEKVNISDIITNGGYTPPIVSLNIPKGWSLVSLNLSDLSTLDDNIKVIWQYKDGKWKAYSNQDSIKTLLEENNYETITDINISNGTWILANEELILPINKNSDTIYSYNNNWTLNGTNKNIESNTLECKNGKLPYTVWKYKNSTNKWSIYSSQIENFTSYTIYANEGFWVDCR